MFSCIKFKKALLMLLLGTAPLTWAQKRDWDYNRYVEANKETVKLPAAERRVVFLGNSITENWAKFHPEFFSKNGFIGRGVSGQTSYQFLVRFRDDVVNLHPEIVVINVGTNDVAENTHIYSEDRTFGNIVTMVQVAQAEGIRPVLTSVLPAAGFGWNKDITDAPAKISSLNKRIRAYAEEHGLTFVDYFPAMVAEDGVSLNPAYTRDGVHPTAEGYDVMESIVLPVLTPSCCSSVGSSCCK